MRSMFKYQWRILLHVMNLGNFHIDSVEKSWKDASSTKQGSEAHKIEFVI